MMLGTWATSSLVSRSWKSSLKGKIYIIFTAKFDHLPLFRTGVDPGFLLGQSQARDSGQEDRQEEKGGHGGAGVAGKSVRSRRKDRLLNTLHPTYLSCAQ